MGAGDEVPSSLTQLGYAVTLLKPEEITPEKLERFDVVMTGVRAYNTVAALANKQNILFDFVKGIGKKNTAPAEQQAAPATPAEPSAQEIANKLLGHIKALGLPVTGLSVSYNGTTDLATIKGQV